MFLLSTLPKKLHHSVTHRYSIDDGWGFFHVGVCIWCTLGTKALLSSPIAELMTFGRILSLPNTMWCRYRLTYHKIEIQEIFCRPLSMTDEYETQQQVSEQPCCNAIYKHVKLKSPPNRHCINSTQRNDHPLTPENKFVLYQLTFSHTVFVII